MNFFIRVITTNYNRFELNINLERIDALINIYLEKLIVFNINIFLN
jgi:hypothetical protein